MFTNFDAMQKAAESVEVTCGGSIAYKQGFAHSAMLWSMPDDPQWLFLSPGLWAKGSSPSPRAVAPPTEWLSLSLSLSSVPFSVAGGIVEVPEPASSPLFEGLVGERSTTAYNS